MPDITLEFDADRKEFTFDGLTLTTSGLQLGLPYDSSEVPQPVSIRRKDGSPWEFLAVSVIGTHSAVPGFQSAWRTVRFGDAPVGIVENSRIKLAVTELSEDVIVLESTNRSPLESIGFRFEVTVKLDADGTAWTSPDPQVVNEKEDLPTGYPPELIHPELHRLSLRIDTADKLDRGMQRWRQS